jgi:hypothetical protein
VIIDCDRCAIRGIGCPDCVISVLLDAPPTVELDDPELRAIETLADAGLVPHLRLIPVDKAPERDDTAAPERRSAERSTGNGGRHRRQVS